MAYMTDRKRAEGTGSAHAGTEHHWRMTVTSAALTILVPLFIFTFGSILGSSYEEVIAYYQRPFPAIVAGLTILVSFLHAKSGARTMVEDYIHGPMRRPILVGLICVAYAAAGTGLFAVAQIAF